MSDSVSSMREGSLGTESRESPVSTCQPRCDRSRRHTNAHRCASRNTSELHFKSDTLLSDTLESTVDCDMSRRDVSTVGAVPDAAAAPAAPAPAAPAPPPPALDVVGQQNVRSVREQVSSSTGHFASSGNDPCGRHPSASENTTSTSAVTRPKEHDAGESSYEGDPSTFAGLEFEVVDSSKTLKRALAEDDWPTADHPATKRVSPSWVVQESLDEAEDATRLINDDVVFSDDKHLETCKTAIEVKMTEVLRNTGNNRRDLMELHYLIDHLSDHKCAGFELMLGQVAVLLATEVTSTELNVMLLMVLLRNGANLLQSTDVDSSRRQIVYYVYSSLFENRKGDNVWMAMHVLYLSLQSTSLPNRVPGLPMSLELEELEELAVNIRRQLTYEDGATDPYLKLVYEVYMNERIRGRGVDSLSSKELAKICYQASWSGSTANYDLWDRMYGNFKGEESWCLADQRRLWNVSCMQYLIITHGFLPTFNTVTWLIEESNTKSSSVHFLKFVRGAIAKAVEWGYFMEFVQFRFLEDRELRQTIAKIVRVPFWKRFCTRMTSRSNHDTRVPTADILTMTENFSIDVKLNRYAYQLRRQIASLFNKSDDELIALYKERVQLDVNIRTCPSYDFDVAHFVGYRAVDPFSKSDGEGPWECSHPIDGIPDILQSGIDPESGDPLDDRIRRKLTTAMNSIIVQKKNIQLLRGPDPITVDLTEQHAHHLMLDTHSDSVESALEFVRKMYPTEGYLWTRDYTQPYNITLLDKVWTAMKRIEYIETLNDP